MRLSNIVMSRIAIGLARCDLCAKDRLFKWHPLAAHCFGAEIDADNGTIIAADTMTPFTTAAAAEGGATTMLEWRTM